MQEPSVILPSISDALATVVAATEAAIIADGSIDFDNGLAKKLYFMHGHPKEVINRLQQMSNSPAKKNEKYPLIALFRDVKETLVQDVYGIGSKFNAHLLICTITKPEYRSEDRELKSFKPILHPIFKEFINQLTLSSVFGTPTLEKMNIVKWDRYFWGTQVADKNILNDYIDAVEIENITLQLRNNIC